jgi:hypothetical protein
MALINTLRQPSGRSAKQKVELAATVIKREVSNGLVEVQVYRVLASLIFAQPVSSERRKGQWQAGAL